ncbi:MAG: type restriction enzyme subunit [Thermoanaerobacter sp.]|nr:type restriction enzyme subunit [Thermoanaerobacter sp.]MDN5365239.1 type restriction enzyme subunit [Thermacetogenium sp.]
MDNYAVPIVSEEGKQAQRWLEDFVDSDKKAPVIATTQSSFRGFLSLK